MQNTYAEIGVDLHSMLHGIARLHVSLGRMDNKGITTRGWSYNELVDGILNLNSTEDLFVKQYKCIDVLFDTLDAIIEIGPRAVSYLHDLAKIQL